MLSLFVTPSPPSGSAPPSATTKKFLQIEHTTASAPHWALLDDKAISTFQLNTAAEELLQADSAEKSHVGKLHQLSFATMLTPSIYTHFSVGALELAHLYGNLSKSLGALGRGECKGDGENAQAGMMTYISRKWTIFGGK
jgi:hypothetical protein